MIPKREVCNQTMSSCCKHNSLRRTRRSFQTLPACSPLRLLKGNVGGLAVDSKEGAALSETIYSLFAYTLFCTFWEAAEYCKEIRGGEITSSQPLISSLTLRVIGAPQMISQPVCSIFPLFSTALCDFANSRPVHSLMLSSHLFLCLPRLLPPFIVPCKMFLARPDERET